MSNDSDIFARLFKQQATIGKLLLDGARDPYEVAALLQRVIDTKFALLCDLGTIAVPEGYDHSTALTVFYEQNSEKFHYYNPAINDINFPNPSRILKPGDCLRVKVYHQIVPGFTTSRERMKFLEAQPRNIYVGAQGAALVWQQKRDELPKDNFYASFDEEGSLWQYDRCKYRFSGLIVNSSGEVSFNFANFKDHWQQKRDVFFGFSHEYLVT